MSVRGETKKENRKRERVRRKLRERQTDRKRKQKDQILYRNAVIQTDRQTEKENRKTRYYIEMQKYRQTND